ncbi:MAG: HD domain-containing protein [Deltaproteobacteria bacterium]
MSTPANVRIRDPIHGTIQLSRDEIALVDHRAFQRLRMIKQLGFADLAFPGATHTRYAHGLGTMHIASRMFDVLSKDYALDDADRRRLEKTVRLAAIFHDLGHAPLSHTTERFMPPAGSLGLGDWFFGPRERIANHEDYTLKIVTDSPLTALLERHAAPHGVHPTDIALLVAGRAPNDAIRRRFVVNGVDWFPALRQCVSSELDADRMDYLLRDSYFAGVPYGRYDHEWLLENLLPVEQNGAVSLGLNARASFGFEDYLLSRYHMFMSVYFHHVAIGYEVMLEQYHDTSDGELALPSDIDAYLACDDVFLHGLLRSSKNPWARRIVERRAFRMVFEAREVVGEASPNVAAPLPPAADVAAAFDAAGIDSIVHQVKGRLSKYFATGSQPPMPAKDHELYIVDEGHAFLVEAYTPLYRRYSGAVHLTRVYVDPDETERAREILGALR